VFRFGVVVHLALALLPARSGERKLMTTYGEKIIADDDLLP